jgi:hypothetical protein
MTAKIDIDLDTYKGNVSFNLLQFIQELDDEIKKELMSDGGFWSFVSHEMVEGIVHEFSRENYNSEYTKLRQMILNSESMPSVIREWAVSVFESMERAKEESDYWRDAYYALYHYVNKYNYQTDMPKLPKRIYGKEYSKDLMDKIKDQIEEWGLLFPDPVVEDDDVEDQWRVE